MKTKIIIGIDPDVKKSGVAINDKSTGIVSASAFQEDTEFQFDTQQVNDLLSALFLIFGLVFVICICKKAIEQ